MATNDSATITVLHQPRPKTSAERGRAFRERQRNASAIRAGKSAAPTAQPVEKPQTFANVRERPTVVYHNGERWVLPPPPTFATLEEKTRELVAACQRGIEAAALFRAQIKSR